MGFKDERLWEILKTKVEQEDKDLQNDLQIGNKYLTAVEEICQEGIDRAATIRDTFPMYTLHNEVHICNVMRLMIYLLGEDVEKLSRDETAMLIMAACCHDIGMSYSEKDKDELFADRDRLNQYLDSNHSAYVKAYANGTDEPCMTDAMIQNYLRSIHHERVMELLMKKEWPEVLESRVDRQNLIYVCQSHGKNISILDNMEATLTIDLRFCAILLRLADILDFDTSRAPKAVYEYSGIENVEDENAIKSKEEWNKHLSSRGFDFLHITERSYPYTLEYNANCRSMQIEQTVNCFLDWVEQELNDCGKQLKRFSGKWQEFILPGKIKRNIRTEGYVSGQYKLTLDQDKILELLVGKDLYSDPSVFVRELIQNAIDAVRTREQLDKNLPAGWKGQINIRCWMDEEGYHWFRIEDNGIGMTEDIIMNYLLKIGSSYYASDNFLQSKIRCKADADYMPISRFGIGILSCFMGDKHTNQVEISTKRFNENGIYYPALRLSMQGMNGYYYLASKNENHMPGPMKGVTENEKQQYLNNAGTVIAVRTNLYQTGKHRGFKEIIDHYVMYPEVAIHYEGVEGSYDYPTEKDFMESIHKIQYSEDLYEKGLFRFTIPQEQLEKFYKERPEIHFDKSPELLLKCIALDDYTESDYLKGAVLTAKVEGMHQPIKIKLGKKEVEVEVRVKLVYHQLKAEVGIQIFLEFTDRFRNKMEEVEEIYDQRNHLIREYFSNICYGLEMSSYSRDIAKGIYLEYTEDPNWIHFMSTKYNVSEKEIYDEVQRLQEEFLQKNQDKVLKQEDILTMKEYGNLVKEWTFYLCSLENYDWYRKYFKNTQKNSGYVSAVAHNGILCGDANFFYSGKIYNNNIGTIVLLKDKYRPNVDVARDGVRKLNLEIDSELAIISKQIQSSGFDIVCDATRLSKDNYSYLAMKKYCTLLDTRIDLLKQLKFRIEGECFTVERLIAELEKKEVVEYMELVPISSNTRYSRRVELLYKFLCNAYIRKNFQLKVKFEKYGSKVFIMKGKSELPNNYENIFPANFFLEPMEESCFLTQKSNYCRNTCNQNHRLSKFLIQNGSKLKEYVPGIFFEILRVLAEEDGENLIKKVNELLTHLRKLPSGIFNVPVELDLTLDDLY